MRNLVRICALLFMGSAVLSQDDRCAATPKLVSTSQKQVYRIGVLAIRGIEKAQDSFQLTFSDYLTATVGSRFDPPIRFEMVPVPFGLWDREPLDEFIEGDYDFVFANPSMFSCIDSEVGMHSLVSQISQRKVGGEVYSLNEFGGVIFASSQNDEVNNIQDLKGKRLGLVSISGLGSGQMQFREMQEAGLHHLQDPSQLIFLENQNNVVKAVLNKEVDVGFVRTDQLERFTDPKTGALLDLSLVKVIGKKEGLTTDDTPFPFVTSTELYPEWALASFPSVDEVVEREVQDSLINLSRHASFLPRLLQCYQLQHCTTTECQMQCFKAVDPEGYQTCESTPSVAILAHQAKSNGKYTGWRPPLSYMEIRNMQEEIGYIKPGTDGFRCARGREVADSIVCPEGHFKKRTAEIENGCEANGIPCYGFQCVCRPCVRAFDVDFFPVASDDKLPISQVGCSKFEICAVVPQRQKVTFRTVDNRKRPNATFSARVRAGTEIEEYTFSQAISTSNVMDHDDDGEDSFVYEFEFDASGRKIGVLIVEVLVNGEQIPESPFRIDVTSQDCSAETGDSLRVPDETGNCICEVSTIEIGSKCVPLKVFLPAIIVPIMVLAAFIVLFCMVHKRRQADLIWKINPREIGFSTPPQVLGKGRFGLVLLAHYRGTRVAVKRVLPPEQTFAYTKAIQAEVMETDGGGRFVPLPKVANHSSPEASRGSDHKCVPSVYDDLQCETADETSESDFDTEVGLKSGFYVASGQLSKRTKSYAKLKVDFVKEMRMLSKLRHPCIMTVMGAVTMPENSSSMLVMEFMELGSLRDVLRSRTMAVDDDTVLRMVQDVAKGIRFLHSAEPNIVHGDLKAQNVLVDSNFRAKVSDFGLSQQRRWYNASATGTPFWMAPELLRGETGNTTMSDVYSFGILLYEAYARAYPYEDEEAKEVLRQVADPNINKRPLMPNRCPQVVVEIAEACFMVQKEHRPTANEIGSKLEQISQAGNKTQALLWQLFPRHVAAALQDGRKVEPETHENVTVFFSDIVGYANLASTLMPTKMSKLLDRLYAKFDALCDLHNVFKIESGGDSFMCATNLAEEQEDHVHIMASFAIDALKAAACTLIDDEDPSLGYVQARAGFHSGRVVSHVVGSRTPRYSVIGDTVNIAAKLGNASSVGRVQCSYVSSNLLHKQNPEAELYFRGELDVEGDRKMATYWVGEAILPGESVLFSDSLPREPKSPVKTKQNDKDRDLDSLIEWNVDVLQRIIRQIVAARGSDYEPGSDFLHLQGTTTGGTVFDEVKEVVPLPPFDADVARRVKEPQGITLPAKAVGQLREFVRNIADKYHDVPFHNFQHASHVTMSVVKLLTRINAVPKELDGNVNEANVTLHQCSYGIASDPITQLAIVFSALIHDVDHQGVPNAQLVKEGSELASVYKGRSVAEQNSVDLAWALFMEDKYSDLRATIAQSDDEMSRFRQLVINCVLATDIVDKELKGLRQQRWDRAFSANNNASDQASVNRKATIVIEYIIQASDIAHTMQQWHVYRKWNERFFRECYAAYKAGRGAEKDPSKGWYEGEIGFFDFYIIPLAKKLQQSGVFGAYGNEYVKNAQANRDEWERRGRDVVTDMLNKVQGKSRDFQFSTGDKDRGLLENLATNRLFAKH